MTVRALIIEPNGRCTVSQIEPTGDAIRAVLDGWLENVTLTEDGAHVYVDEEGKLNDKIANPLATLVVGHYLPHFPSIDIICGTAVFLGSDDGDEADVPQEVIDVAERIVQRAKSAQN